MVASEMIDLATLVGPNGRHTQAHVLEALVVDFLMGQGDNSGLRTECSTAVEAKWKLSGIPPESIESAIGRLIESNAIIAFGERIQLKDSIAGEVEEHRANVRNFLKGMFDDFYEKVRSLYADLDPYDKPAVKSFLEEALKKILNDLGGGVVNFLDKGSEDCPHEPINVATLVSDTNFQFRDQRLSQACVAALQENFHEPSGEFSAGVYELASRWCIMKTLNTGHLEETIARELAACELFVDTNVLISNLCEGSSHHKTTKLIINKTIDAGVSLKVFDITLQEFEQALTHAREGMTRARQGNMPLDFEDNEIIKSFRIAERRGVTWRSFEDSLNTRLSEWMEENKVIEVAIETIEIDADVEAHARSLISKHYLDVGRKNNWELVRFDAAAIAAIQKLRAGEEKGLHGPWFLTRQPSLANPDRLIQHSHFEEGYPSTVSLEIWFEIIEPFLLASIGTQETADAFTRVIADSYLPTLPKLSISSFIGSMAEPLGIDGGQKTLIEGIVRESPLRGKLASAIDERDKAQSLDLLARILTDHKGKIEAENSSLKESNERLQTLLKMEQAQPKTEITVIGDKNIVATDAASVEAIIDSDNGKIRAQDDETFGKIVKLAEEALTLVGGSNEALGQILSDAREVQNSGRPAIVKRIAAWLKDNSDLIIASGSFLLQIQTWLS